MVAMAVASVAVTLALTPGLRSGAVRAPVPAGGQAGVTPGGEAAVPDNVSG